MGMYDKSKFVFSETFNNKDGKTSGSGFIGIILGLVAAASFCAAMVGWYLKLPNTVEVMGIILQLCGIVGILLGVRKVSSDFTERKNGNGTTAPVTPPKVPVDPNKG